MVHVEGCRGLNDFREHRVYSGCIGIYRVSSRCLREWRIRCTKKTEDEMGTVVIK